MIENKVVSILLRPFSWLYSGIISLRNTMYDTNILRSSKFSVPIISVGNLVIGGAGKTPHIEYLIRLLNPYLEIGTLSRGYNRNTSGYRLVKPEDSALSVGDEPLMYARKYRDIMVAVAENRALGIPQMVMRQPFLQSILLDDAFQHRSVDPHINILLSPFDHPYSDDVLLPAGRLREPISAAVRADIIIVTKCPDYLSSIDQEKMIHTLQLKDHQEIYFTKYEYGKPYSMYNGAYVMDLSYDLDAIVISAIANTDYMLQYVKPKVASTLDLNYTDHHNFTIEDVDYIIQTFKTRNTEKKILITTEKDAMRLSAHIQKFHENNIPLFVLPVRVVFCNTTDQGQFDTSIKKRLLEFKA